MAVPPDSPRTTNPNTFSSSPPDLDRLRAWADWNDQDPYSTGGPAEEAARFLLSLLDEGGRLVVEQPCEHGNHDAHPFPDKRIGDFPYCPGGSRKVVWSADKEEE